jgi:hypothetical protein
MWENLGFGFIGSVVQPPNTLNTTRALGAMVAMFT